MLIWVWRMIEARLIAVMALCACFVLGSGTLAVAGAETAWGFASERCLLPQQEVQPADTAGLTALPGPVPGMSSDAVAWVGDDPRLVLVVAGAQLIASVECRVSFEGTADEVRGFAALFDDWAFGAVSRDFYIQLAGDARHLESFEWREPVLRVQFLLAEETGYAEFRAYEIDKEA